MKYERVTEEEGNKMLERPENQLYKYMPLFVMVEGEMARVVSQREGTAYYIQ